VELYLNSPITPSWCGAQLGGAQGQLYLYLIYRREENCSVLLKSLRKYLVLNYKISKRFH
jgi:hypothetical protein